MAKKRKLENKSASTPSKEQQLEAHQQQDQEEEEQQQQQQEQIKLNGEAAAAAEEITEDAIEAEDAEVEEEEEDENLWPAKTTEDAGAAANASNSGTGGAETTSASAEGADVNDGDDDEPIQKLIEPFSKEQIIDLLREAAENHPDVNERIRNLADAELVHRKIFVHGLGWDTNAEVLINTFKNYGEIEDCNAVCDKVTGKSKGYGFILFKNRKGARNALKEPQKKIGNRMTACQLASSGPVPTPPAAQPAAAAPASEYTQRKIYVSNVSADIDPQKLLGFFVKFGEIEEGPLGLDKQTGKPKGFALFVYKSAESAKKALEEPHKNFEGHILHCQKAIDGPKPNKPYYQQPYQQQQQHGAGRGTHFARSDSANIMGGIGNHNSAVTGSVGHLMAPSQPGVSYNQGASQALNPVLGQAITALLATQGGGAGLGLTNLLGALGSSGAAVNQPMVNNAMQGGYGNQAVGTGYGSQTGYSNPQMGQGSAGRSQPHLGGVNHYMGH